MEKHSFLSSLKGIVQQFAVSFATLALLLFGGVAFGDWNSSTPSPVGTPGNVSKALAAGVMYETACAWRYDYREGAVNVGSADNWMCSPPACATGYVSLTVRNEPVGVACSGSTSCYFDSYYSGYHPVSVGRSVRVCALQ